MTTPEESVVRPFWAESPSAVLAAVGSRPEGLRDDEVRARRVGQVKRKPSLRVWRTLVAQFGNPLVLMLIVAAAISFLTGAVHDAAIILGIVVLSGGVGFVQEHAANQAVDKLLAMVKTKASVRRDGSVVRLATEDLVVGDVVVLEVGATVPADARILETEGLQVDEAPLTGESFPVEKGVSAAPADARPSARSSGLFQGTHVVSGGADAVIVALGEDTELGRIGKDLDTVRPPTDFDLGLQRFGALLVKVSAILVLSIFALNVLFDRPVLESFLFSVAIAVGLVPELLPAIVTVNLTRGARRMAEGDVIVKRLSSIEDFGAVDVLCSDKTGTLTEGRIHLHSALGVDGSTSPRALELGWLNATFESGYKNPIDEALRAAHPGEPEGWVRRGEVAYDFVRKRLSVLLDKEGRRWLVTKGQPASVLGACARAEMAIGVEVELASVRGVIEARVAALAGQGLRTLAVAVREVPSSAQATRELERDMVFVGLLAFTDPVKSDAPSVLAELDRLGVRLQMITGDDHRVAGQVWRSLRGRDAVVMTGTQLRDESPAALERRVSEVDVFAEVDPSQKERVIQALRRAGHVVAYMGDGINDAPALRVADVGISVDSAADVAREAADIVLRRPDLGAVAKGIGEGRRTMVNTLKYVHYTTSANFGNMIAMAVASVFLPFLPLLPKQILLNNFLSDLPAMTIAGDEVDALALERPRRWENSEIRRFMILFGSISSLFDILTFAVLLELSDASADVFRTGWFIESLWTEVLVLFVLRSQLPFGTTRASNTMIGVTVAVAVLTLALPYVAWVAAPLGLVPLEWPVLLTIVGIVLAYVVTTEIAKRWFFKRAAAGGSR